MNKKELATELHKVGIDKVSNYMNINPTEWVYTTFTEDKDGQVTAFTMTRDGENDLAAVVEFDPNFKGEDEDCGPWRADVVDSFGMSYQGETRWSGLENAVSDALDVLQVAEEAAAEDDA